MKLFSTFGKYILLIKGMFTKPENFKMYWKELMHQCVEIGIGALGIVSIISIFMGAVSAVQTGYQLTSALIPRSTIAQVVRDTVILEFAPTLVCIAAQPDHLPAAQPDALPEPATKPDENPAL